MSQQPIATGSSSNGRRAFELAPDDIKNLIECSVCLTTPRDGYIYQCDNGHLHCSKCHLKLKTCPVCRVPLRNTRNLLAEKQIERLPFKCSLGGDCNIELPKSELIVHEKEECRFRKITCVAFCGAKVPFINFVKHMESHCRPKAFKPPICLSFSYKMGESLSDYKPIDLREIKERFSCSLHAFDKQFYLQGIRSCGFTIFFMYFFGLKKDAKFWYSLEFTDTENQEILCWKKKVIPIDIPLEEIFKSKTSMCLEMTDGMMRNFVKSDKYHFKIQITSNNNTVAPNSTSGGSEQN